MRWDLPPPVCVACSAAGLEGLREPSSTLPCTMTSFLSFYFLSGHCAVIQTFSMRNIYTLSAPGRDSWRLVHTGRTVATYANIMNFDLWSILSITVFMLWFFNHGKNPRTSHGHARLSLKGWQTVPIEPTSNQESLQTANMEAKKTRECEAGARTRKRLPDSRFDCADFCVFLSWPVKSQGFSLWLSSLLCCLVRSVHPTDSPR